MKVAPLHPEEQLRLETLRSYDILDTELDARFQLLVQQASELVGVPIGVVSLVDGERQWFKARFGLDATETPRDVAFCAHAILGEDLFVVEDARGDERFHDNPLVTSAPHVIFYAGAPLRARNGMPLGTLCVIDSTPRQLTDAQRASLKMLARQVEVLLEIRQRARRINGIGVNEPAALGAPKESMNPQATAHTPSMRMTNITEMYAWSAFAQTVNDAIAKYSTRAFREVTPPLSPRETRDQLVATILPFDPKNQVCLRLDVAIDRALLTLFAKDLFGDDIDDELERAVLLECANLMMGAVKGSYEAEHGALTASLPKESEPNAAADAFLETTRAQRHVLATDGGTIDVRISLEAKGHRRVLGAEAREGMVLLRDVRDGANALLATIGARLTLTSAELIASRAAAAELLVAEL